MEAHQDALARRRKERKGLETPEGLGVKSEFSITSAICKYMKYYCTLTGSLATSRRPSRGALAVLAGHPFGPRR